MNSIIPIRPQSAKTYGHVLPAGSSPGTQAPGVAGTRSYAVLALGRHGQNRPSPPPPPTLPLHTHCILSFFHDHFSIVLLFTLHLRRDTDRKKSHQVIVLVWCIVSKKLDGSNILKNLWNVLIYLSACEIALLSKLLYFNFYCQFILVLWYQ